MANRGQIRGPLGGLVRKMIDSSLKKGFRHLLWTPPAEPLPPQIILVANHHGWFDGYAAFALLERLDRPFLDWIAEYDSFPLFGHVGGMPFPPHDPAARTATVRRTIRLMREEGVSLLLFAEGVLHEGPDLLPFGRSLDLVAAKVPDARVIPCALVYAMGIHQLPECRLRLGEPVLPGADLAARTRAEVARLLDLERENPSTELLLKGTRDVNERMKFPKFPPKRAPRKR